jgi:hypothetical protein
LFFSPWRLGGEGRPAACEFLRGPIPQRAMGPNLVVIPPPGFDFLSCILQADEPILIQAFIPELPVEALDESILDGLAWLDEAQLHASLVGPHVQGLAGEFRPVLQRPMMAVINMASRKSFTLMDFMANSLQALRYTRALDSGKLRHHYQCANSISFALAAH